MRGHFNSRSAAETQTRLKILTLVGHRPALRVGLKLKSQAENVATETVLGSRNLGKTFAAAIESQRIEENNGRVNSSYHALTGFLSPFYLAGTCAVVRLGFTAHPKPQEHEATAVPSAVHTSIVAMSSGMMAQLIGLQGQMRLSKPGPQHEEKEGGFNFYILVDENSPHLDAVSLACGEGKRFNDKFLFTFTAPDRSWIYGQPWAGKVRGVFTDQTYNNLLQQLSGG